MYNGTKPNRKFTKSQIIRSLLLTAFVAAMVFMCFGLFHKALVCAAETREILSKNLESEIVQTAEDDDVYTVAATDSSTGSLIGTIIVVLAGISLVYVVLYLTVGKKMKNDKIKKKTQAYVNKIEPQVLAKTAGGRAVQMPNAQNAAQQGTAVSHPMPNQMRPAPQGMQARPAMASQVQHAAIAANGAAIPDRTRGLYARIFSNNGSAAYNAYTERQKAEFDRRQILIKTRGEEATNGNNYVVQRMKQNTNISKLIFVRNTDIKDAEKRLAALNSKVNTASSPQELETVKQEISAANKLISFSKEDLIKLEYELEKGKSILGSKITEVDATIAEFDELESLREYIRDQRTKAEENLDVEYRQFVERYAHDIHNNELLKSIDEMRADLNNQLAESNQMLIDGKIKVLNNMIEDIKRIVSIKELAKAEGRLAGFETTIIESEKVPEVLAKIDEVREAIEKRRPEILELERSVLAPIDAIIDKIDELNTMEDITEAVEFVNQFEKDSKEDDPEIGAASKIEAARKAIEIRKSYIQTCGEKAEYFINNIDMSISYVNDLKGFEEISAKLAEFERQLTESERSDKVMNLLSAVKQKLEHKKVELMNLERAKQDAAFAAHIAEVNKILDAIKQTVDGINLCENESELISLERKLMEIEKTLGEYEKDERIQAALKKAREISEERQKYLAIATQYKSTLSDIQRMIDTASSQEDINAIIDKLKQVEVQAKSQDSAYQVLSSNISTLRKAVNDKYLSIVTEFALLRELPQIQSAIEEAASQESLRNCEDRLDNVKKAFSGFVVPEAVAQRIAVLRAASESRRDKLSNVTNGIVQNLSQLAGELKGYDREEELTLAENKLREIEASAKDAGLGIDIMARTENLKSLIALKRSNLRVSESGAMRAVLAMKDSFGAYTSLKQLHDAELKVADFQSTLSDVEKTPAVLKAIGDLKTAIADKREDINSTVRSGMSRLNDIYDDVRSAEDIEELNSISDNLSAFERNNKNLLAIGDITNRITDIRRALDDKRNHVTASVAILQERKVQDDQQFIDSKADEATTLNDKYVEVLRRIGNCNIDIYKLQQETSECKALIDGYTKAMQSDPNSAVEITPKLLEENNKLSRIDLDLRDKQSVLRKLNDIRDDLDGNVKAICREFKLENLRRTFDYDNQKVQRDIDQDYKDFVSSNREAQQRREEMLRSEELRRKTERDAEAMRKGALQEVIQFKMEGLKVMLNSIEHITSFEDLNRYQTRFEEFTAKLKPDERVAELSSLIAETKTVLLRKEKELNEARFNERDIAPKTQQADNANSQVLQEIIRIRLDSINNMIDDINHAGSLDDLGRVKESLNRLGQDLTTEQRTDEVMRQLYNANTLLLSKQRELQDRIEMTKKREISELIAIKRDALRVIVDEIGYADTQEALSRQRDNFENFIRNLNSEEERAEEMQKLVREGKNLLLDKESEIHRKRNMQDQQEREKREYEERRNMIAERVHSRILKVNSLMPEVKSKAAVNKLLLYLDQTESLVDRDFRDSDMMSPIDACRSALLRIAAAMGDSEAHPRVRRPAQRIARPQQTSRPRYEESSRYDYDASGLSERRDSVRPRISSSRRRYGTRPITLRASARRGRPTRSRLVLRTSASRPLRRRPSSRYAVRGSRPRSTIKR